MKEHVLSAPQVDGVRVQLPQRGEEGPAQFTSQASPVYKCPNTQKSQIRNMTWEKEVSVKTATGMSRVMFVYAELVWIGFSR